MHNKIVAATDPKNRQVIAGLYNTLVIVRYNFSWEHAIEPMETFQMLHSKLHDNAV